MVDMPTRYGPRNDYRSNSGYVQPGGKKRDARDIFGNAVPRQSSKSTPQHRRATPHGRPQRPEQIPRPSGRLPGYTKENEAHHAYRRQQIPWHRLFGF